LYTVLLSGPALRQFDQMLPIGSQAGVVYSRLFNYTQQAAGYTEKNWSPHLPRWCYTENNWSPHIPRRCYTETNWSPHLPRRCYTENNWSPHLPRRCYTENNWSPHLPVVTIISKLIL